MLSGGGFLNPFICYHCCIFDKENISMLLICGYYLHPWSYETSSKCEGGTGQLLKKEKEKKNTGYSTSNCSFIFGRNIFSSGANSWRRHWCWSFTGRESVSLWLKNDSKQTSWWKLACSQVSVITVSHTAHDKTLTLYKHRLTKGLHGTTHGLLANGFFFSNTDLLVGCIQTRHCIVWYQFCGAVTGI